MTDDTPKPFDDVSDWQQSLIDGMVLTTWIVILTVAGGVLQWATPLPWWSALIAPAVLIAYATVQTARRGG